MKAVPAGTRYSASAECLAEALPFGSRCIHALTVPAFPIRIPPPAHRCLCMGQAWPVRRVCSVKITGNTFLR